MIGLRTRPAGEAKNWEEINNLSRNKLHIGETMIVAAPGIVKVLV